MKIAYVKKSFFVVLVSLSLSSSLLAAEENSESPKGFLEEIKHVFEKVMNWVTCSQGACPVETPKEEQQQWKDYVDEENEVLVQAGDT